MDKQTKYTWLILDSSLSYLKALGSSAFLPVGWLDTDPLIQASSLVPVPCLLLVSVPCLRCPRYSSGTGMDLMVFFLFVAKLIGLSPGKQKKQLVM